MTQSLILSELPRLVDAALANDSHLSKKVKLIYIDNNFSNQDNPALESYAKIVQAGCPKCEDSRPKTMQELKVYWELDLSESELLAQKLGDRTPILLFHENPAASPPGFSEAFLKDLSKFSDSRIGVVTSPANIVAIAPTPDKLEGEETERSTSPSSVAGEGVGGWGSIQFFSPSQANLVEDIVGWIRAIVLEDL